jgi:hypothetical protein
VDLDNIKRVHPLVVEAHATGREQIDDGTLVTAHMHVEAPRVLCLTTRWTRGCRARPGR